MRSPSFDEVSLNADPSKVQVQGLVKSGVDVRKGCKLAIGGSVHLWAVTGFNEFVISMQRMNPSGSRRVVRVVKVPKGRARDVFFRGPALSWMTPPKT